MRLPTGAGHDCGGTRALPLGTTSFSSRNGRLRIGNRDDLDLAIDSRGRRSSSRGGRSSRRGGHDQWSSTGRRGSELCSGGGQKLM